MEYLPIIVYHPKQDIFCFPGSKTGGVQNRGQMMSTSNCPHLGPDTLSMTTKESAEASLQSSVTSDLPHIPSEGREGESVNPGLMGLVEECMTFSVSHHGGWGLFPIPSMCAKHPENQLVEMNESPEGKVMSCSLA